MAELKMSIKFMWPSGRTPRARYGISIKHLSFIVFFLYAPSFSKATQCSQLLLSSDVYKRVRIMTYNVQNLYIQKEKHKGANARKKHKHKEERHIEEITRIIVETSPDFVVLQEVETSDSLNRLIENYLRGEYSALLVENYGKRSMTTALLIKNDLKFYVRVRPVDGLTWKAPSNDVEPIFSRKLGVFEVFDTNREVVLGIFGVHFKSYKDRSRDPKSFLKRSKEVGTTVQIINQFITTYPDTPFVVAGDFNSKPNAPELLPLFEDLDTFDPIRNPDTFVDKADMGTYTHSFHEKGVEESVYSEVDFILTSKELKDFIIGADVYRYKDRQTNDFKPLPDSNKERAENPSDHFPVFVDIRSEAFDKVSEIEKNK